ncbi:class I SAM-dependent methyltransferase [Candidatus Bathyarchaeota archaeon]|nr:class I SAM-dependent methyltransferase [Candidatus Bathyarchaeota archaeon]
MKDEFNLEAKLYDEVWGKRDYDKDVKFLNSLFRKYNCRSILDVGCGTGNHSIRLSKLGYEVTGIDISASMLKMARKKNRTSKIRFLQSDMKKLGEVIPKGSRFDAAICLGHVLSHLMTDKDLRAFLSGLHKILKEKSIFVFSAKNAKRINERYLNVLRLDHMINKEKLRLALFSYNSRDMQDTNTLMWRPIYILKENGKMDLQIREHKLRWFEFLPLKKIVEKSGFDVLTIHSGPEKEKFRENEHDDMWFVTRVR